MTLKELARKVDMTEAGFHRALKNKSLKVKTLERVSEVLQVPIAFLFGEEQQLEEQDDAAYNKREGEVEERLRELEQKVERIRRSLPPSD